VSEVNLLLATNVSTQCDYTREREKRERHASFVALVTRRVACYSIRVGNPIPKTKSQQKPKDEKHYANSYPLLRDTRRVRADVDKQF